MVEFALEPLGLARPDIESLHPMQWAQFGDSNIPCEPNWNLYYQFDDRQAMLTVMARDLGVPVGYLWAFIYPHPNAVSRKIASIPTYFVVNRPTRALIMSRMVDFALEKLASRGIYRVDIDTNAEHSAGRLWELKGFKVAKIGYSMRLEKPPGERYA